LIIRFDTKLIKQYWFSLGGDMSETMGIAVNHEGEVITYEEFKKIGGSVKPIHVLELEDEFLVVNHDNPISNREYETFHNIYNVRRST